ncbi:aldo/keto reductase [Actinoplanes couchii]|uniref:Oxidoreductase n=1 Tax=Actinoplanes couchii TaxID=403638 RepID=A0ABQ3XR83_9ACTN|nr:aldo/keto reductase [Actinoplanes couchii]MDR6318186.1 aryl-alcohol dehydrogenase-like predicted oxidoreductase [Actinoplanes couchii]GID60980.1 oxidoreductase [Actinoplanes couchii]
MQQRTLGRQGLTVSALGYGAMGTVIAFGPSDDTESIAAIRRAHELGVTHFDTAELYGWGAGEKLLGQALAPIRDQVTIATKFGFTPSYGADSRPDHIREVVDNSLRSLNVDMIDLLYQHQPDPNVPVEDVVGTMKELVDAGKVKYLGLSNTGADDIRRAHAVHPISAFQGEYSIFERGVESLLPTLEELGIGLVAYSPVARGFLTGTAKSREHYTADDFRQNVGWWAPENFDANVALAAELTKVADSKGAALSQLALAWLLARKDYIVPIPGSRNPARVEENIAAAGLTLTADDLARIDAIVPNGAIGGRWT